MKRPLRMKRLRSRLFRLSRIALIFVIVFSWVFAGYPQFWGMPPSPSPVYAQQIAAPNSDISNDGGWSPTPIYQQLNTSSADDDTYVQTGNNPGTGDTFVVGLATTTNPNTTSGHLIRVRAAKDGGTRDGFVQVNLYQGTTLIHEGSVKGPLSDGAFDTYVENISSSNAEDITDYSDLRIEVVPSQSTGGQPTRVNVSWLQFEVPSVAAGGPPEVTTNDVFDIESDRAEAEGEVTDDQGGTITRRGFVWGETSRSDPGNVSYLDSGYDRNTSEVGQFGEETFTRPLTGLDHATTYYVRAFAENSEGYSYGEELDFTTDSVPPFVDTLSATNINRFQADGRGEVTDTGGETVTERGFVWSTVSRGDPGNTSPGNTNYDDFTNVTGSFGVGEFSLTMEDLEEDTLYYYRAYAYSSEGYSYGDQREFRTLGEMPAVLTHNPTNINRTSVTGQGQVTDQGASSISERGFVWSTTSRSNPGNIAPGDTDYEDFVDQTGTFGETSFSLTLDDLNPDTEYYYRAYAENSEGYAYGPEVKFTTLDSRPVVSTNAASDILTRSFEANGSVTDDGGSTIEERGFVWSTTSYPSNPGDVSPGNTDYDDFFTESGTFGEDSFSSVIRGLKFNTTYYYRAFARNEDGYSYGSQVSLTTANAQFARPSDDLLVSGWQSEPLYEKLNSTDRDDGTFIYSSNDNNNDTAEISVSEVDDPAVNTGHVLRYTYRKNNSGGNSTDFSISLLDGGTEIASSTHIDIGSTFTLAELILTEEQAGNIENYDDLRIEVSRGGTVSAPPASRRSVQVSWVEFEVPIAPDYNPPSVSTSPTVIRDTYQAQVSGSVTNAHGLEVIERGFVWGKEHQSLPDSETSPDSSGYSDWIADTEGPFGEGSFSEVLEGLDPNTEYFFRAYAENSEGFGYGGQIRFRTFDEVPTVETVDSDDVGADSAELIGEIVHEGISDVDEVGFIYSTENIEENPGNVPPSETGYDFISEEGDFEEGQFGLLLDELDSDTIYYFRAYAGNEQGYGYGEMLGFQTHGDLPLVFVNNPSDIGLTQADGHGVIDREGLTTPTEVGFVWSRNSQSLPGNIGPEEEGFPYQFSTSTEGTFGTGPFSLTMGGLGEGNVYFYRAYAKNDQGYSYSADEIMFHTLSSRPALLTHNPIGIQYNSATGRGEVLSEGDSAIIEVGFVWSTESHGDPGDMSPAVSSYERNTLESYESDVFEGNLDNLDDDTEYFYRSVARNDDGWSYGNEIKFTTPQEPLPPVLSNIELNNTGDIYLIEGSTTTVPVSAVVTDPNGWEDIREDLLQGVVYRSGVGEECEPDPNNCYQVENLSLDNCEGNTCDIVGSVPMWFFADPTDDGDYSLEHWEFWVYVEDSHGFSDEGSSEAHPESGHVDVMTLLAIWVGSSEIDYGEFEMGEDTGDSNVQTIIRNTGNSAVAVEVSGESMQLEPGSEIEVSRQQWAAMAFTYGAGTELTGEGVNTGIELSKPTSTDPVEDSIFWGLGLPEANLRVGRYKGVNSFIAVPVE